MTKNLPWPYNLLNDVFGYDFEEIDNDQMRGLEYAIGTLTERERNSLLESYSNGATIEQIAAIYNVTRSRIQQIMQKGIRKLRHPSRARYITKGYFVASGELFEKAFERWLPEIERAKEAAEQKISEYEAMAKGVEVKPVNGNRGMHIDDMFLSVRAYNCLRRAGYDTVDKILAAEGWQMRTIRNLGQKSLDEIYKKLRDLGFTEHDNGDPLVA